MPPKGTSNPDVILRLEWSPNIEGSRDRQMPAMFQLPFIQIQYGECDPYDGQCKCPPGWGGIDCLAPRTLSLIILSYVILTYIRVRPLADGDKRRLREDDKQCECKEGWGGINCNGMQLSYFATFG